MRRFFMFLPLAIPLFTAACQESSPPPATLDTQQTIFGHCVYMNPFSKTEECREFRGNGWTTEAATDECRAQSAELVSGACAYEQTLGACVLKGEPEKGVALVFPGDDAAACANMELGCEVFAGGEFVASEICAGKTDDTPVTPGTTVFVPPELICRDPLAGEPPGMSEGGQVCTWQMISGATEPGRHFPDYASCSTVLTQRPYYPTGPGGIPTRPDARLDDPAYAADLAWVKEQVEATACTCCHQGSVTPKGAAVWDIEAEGNWVNTFSPYGLAFAGGFLDSSLLGAYPASENNGFDRATTGIPTTDPARMAAFFAKELEHRGFSTDDYKDWAPVPEFFYEQATYEPSACDAGAGVDKDLSIRWNGGRARYIYVLDASSKNPGVPPNLDLPEGTIWRVDVPPTESGLASGEVRYGELPQGMKQAFPASGAPTKLDAGKTYYLYVLADMAAPITRCLFTLAAP